MTLPIRYTDDWDRAKAENDRLKPDTLNNYYEHVLWELGWDSAITVAHETERPPWLDDLLDALGWQGGTAHDAIAAVRRLVRAAKERDHG